ncbi:MAG TPA: DUF4150 domain-containing protein [Polyangia bacterium]|nr:DUF4150 domain-containing protein [Polyangia bacterium]
MAAIFPASTDGGGQSFAFPDVCKTPAPPGPPLPLPYPNIAMLTDSSETSSKVKICNKKAVHKSSEVTRTSADEPGVAGGVVSSKDMGETKWKQGSSKVKIEGKDAVHLVCAAGHNGTNSNAPGGVQVAPSQTKVIVAP